MNFTKLLFGVIIIPLFTSCQPKILTDIIKTYPAISTDSVHVYEIGDTIPNNAETLGNMAIIDQGFTSNCKYDHILFLAKKVAAESGGNGLAIAEHGKPSIFGSSCHQIKGTVLYIKDMTIYPTLNNPFIEARKEQIEMAKVYAEDHSIPSHSISINGGYGFIVSNFYDEKNHNVSGIGGFSFSINYNWTSKMGLGVGLQYAKISFLVSGSTVGLTHIAPVFSYSLRARKWMFDYGIGVGYIGYKEKLNNKTADFSGVAYNIKLGMNYMLTKHVGLGLSWDYISGRLPDETNPNKGLYSHAGINYLNFLGGVKYFF